MAPMFTSSSPNSGETALKPTFSFNMQNPRGSNFFAPRPGVQIQQQEQQMDGSWDMSDDVSDGTHNDNDDSRALVYSGDEQEDTMQTFDSSHPGYLDTYAEVEAFAMRLDLSTTQSDDPSGASVVSGYNLIDSLQEVATSRLELLKEQKREDPTDEQHADLDYWQLEHQTWEIFGTLTSHRLKVTNIVQDLPPQLVQNKYTSNAGFRTFLLGSDRRFNEWTLILDWLCKYAPDPTDGYDEVGGKHGSGWTYTKASLKHQKRIPGKKLLNLKANSNLFFSKKAERRDLVTELDPDAPSRQQRKLEDEDVEAERNFMRFIWGYIRKGDLNGAKQVCNDLGEWWRAASLCGNEEAHDYNIDGCLQDADGVQTTEPQQTCVVGNRRRELWRRMCFAIAHRSGGDEWEKAVYGALCGDVESVRLVCGTWEDHLFAHMNSLIEQYYTDFLTNYSRIPSSIVKFPIFNSTAFHSRTGTLDDDSIITRIIDSLAVSPILRHESRMPLRVIQGAVLSSRVYTLVAELDRQLQILKVDPNYDVLNDHNNIGLDVTDHRTLRVVVHIILILQSLSKEFTEYSPYHASAENIIEAYIEFLSECGKNELIPLYAGRLSPAKAVEVVGNILVKVRDNGQRLELLQLMRMHHIDVEGCLVRTMEICLELTKNMYERERKRAVRLTALRGEGLKGELSREDDMLVRGLEWLVLGGDGLKSEVIKKGVVVYRRFLLAGRLSAAKVVYDKVHSKDIILSPGYSGHHNNLSTSVHRHFADQEAFWYFAVYIDIEILIRSLMALDDWNEIIKKRPERFDRIWKTSLTAAYENVGSKLMDTIKTWLDDPLADALQNYDTSFISDLKNIYIPELTFALHDVYLEAGRSLNKTLLSNCLELATVVADPGRSVLGTFVQTGRVEEYVCAVAGASRSVLGAGTEKGRLGIWNVR